MQSTECKKEREKMFDMHDYFIKHIDKAMNNENYIEANWLIYSCFENRYFRILLKIKKYCSHCTSKSKCSKKNNELALSTKIKCIQRLNNENVLCIYEAFRGGLFTETLEWVKDRNHLMHELLSLNTYQEAYEMKFKKSAEKGWLLLKETYDSCTKFRKFFYDEKYIFEFPESCMGKCFNKTSNRLEEK